MAIIIGANELSVEVSRELIKMGYDVTIVDSNDEQCSRAYKILKSSASVYRGDPSNPEVLTEVGIDKAEVLIAVHDDDDINYKVCNIGKERGVPLIIARVNSPGKEDLFKELNVTTINASRVLATHIVNVLSRSVTSYTDPNTNMKFAIINISSQSPLLGKRILDLASDYDVTIPYVLNVEGKVTKPNEDMVVEGGMTLVVIGMSDNVNKLISSMFP